LPNREGGDSVCGDHPLEMERCTLCSNPNARDDCNWTTFSLPLPPMATPDMRQTMLEVVLDMCGANGVDDIHLIIANSLHRKITPGK